MYTSFMNNQVPALWTRVSFASLKSLASWNKDLLFRYSLQKQYDRCTGILKPVCLSSTLAC